MGDLVGQQFGNYMLTRLLGRGGFAEVYLGQHAHLDTQAAIKVLHIQADQEQRELILKEARTSARLDHPHIARLLEYGFQGETPYMVMPYAPGGTLRTRHPRGSKLPFERIVFYTLQIAEALQYAHDEKVIHRDVKPENVLIGPHKELLLSDFGIAIMAHHTQSLSEQRVVGTSVYMAPEQARRLASPVSDQYALAIVVYEWIYGTPPFTGTPLGVALQHLFDQPPALQVKGPLSDVAEEYIRQVLTKALSKDPHGRFPSVMAFARALEEISRGHRPGPGISFIIYRGHPGGVNALAWSPSQRYIVTGGEDATAQVWEADSGRTRHVYLEHAHAIKGLAWSPDSSRIASASDDTTVQVWNAQIGERLSTYQGHTDHAVAVAWSPDGGRIASASWDRSVQVWDANTGARILTYRGHDHGGENPLEITALAWSPDGERIASGGEDRAVHVWDAHTGRQLATYRERGLVHAIAWSPDGQLIVSASWDPTIQIWDPRTGQQVRAYLGHSRGALCLAWSPDGSHIASGSMDKTVQVWDPVSGACIFIFHEHAAHINAVAWSSDGRRIASVGADGVVYVWQAELSEPW